jgi:outer membrane receptor protein involved in Fe transport
MFPRRAFCWGTVFLYALPALRALPGGASGSVAGVIRDSQSLSIADATIIVSGTSHHISRTTSGPDGFYSVNLAPGKYVVHVEKSGFRTETRTNVLIAASEGVVLDFDLAPATRLETVLVRAGEGRRPVSALSATLDSEHAKDVPSATNLWAVLALSPGIRMRGYDVGGSRKAEQIDYDSAGIAGQHRIVSEGVDSTEGTSGAGLYYDYYSVAEFQVTTAGAGVEMTSPGAQIVMTVKSGGDELSGLFHLDYEPSWMVGNNVDPATAARGFTGNPNLLYWEGHADVGGPLAAGHAWFFGAVNHYELTKAVSGVVDGADRSLFDNYTTKLTFDLTEWDRLVAYGQLGHKRRFNQGLSLLTPVTSTRDRDGWSWVSKLEWQRAWSDRTLTELEVRHFGLSAGDKAKSDPEAEPERFDLSTGAWSGSPGDFSQRRSKPQLSAQLESHEPFDLRGHSMTAGIEWYPDLSSFQNDGTAVYYIDDPRKGRPHGVNWIQFTNTPRGSDFVDNHLDLSFQDRWSLHERLTLVGGVRFSHQHVHYHETELNPRYPQLFFSGTIPAQSLVTWNTLSPRVGAVAALSEDGRTIARASFGRYVVNLADTVATSHPNVFAGARYVFADPNENGILDGLDELGAPVFKARGTPSNLNPEFSVSYADEVSIGLERQIEADISIRGAFVHKVLDNDFGRWDVAQGRALLESPVSCGDDVFPCPSDPFTGKPLALVRLPEELFYESDVRIDTYPDARYTYDTLDLSVAARRGPWLWISAGFDYEWRDELKSNAANESPEITDPISGGYFQNHNPSVSNRQTTSNWQGHLLGRISLPKEAAVAVNLRHQSGFSWAPIYQAEVPGSGFPSFFLENLVSHRSRGVTLVDVRLQTAFLLPKGRLSLFLDAYNLLNSNAETNFVLLVNDRYRDIVAALDPRTLKVGIRWEF